MMSPKEFKKKYPDRDNNGYPCKIVYPSKTEFESQVVMVKGLIKPKDLFQQFANRDQWEGR